MSGGRLTLTAADDERGSTTPEPRPFLFRVLDRQRPTAAAARFCLAGLERVTIGRGAGPPARAGAELRLAVDDPHVSSTHATLRRDGGWRIEDSSKNGTLVNGERVDSVSLADGDVIEIAATFFRLRLGIESIGEDLGDVGSDELSGLTTLLPSVQRAFDRLERVARSPLSVVLRGETGTGKEVAARAVHALSRRAGPFVAVNCAALAPTLVESELFGYRRGAFSGAVEDRPGLVRSAGGGTLLLDEVGDLSLAAQAALLRVLQEREVLAIGATEPTRVDLRVIAASQRSLRDLVAEGSFRADLEARLCGIEIELPPLRDRLEDLGLLAAAILTRASPAEARGVSLERAAARALLAYAWPNNIRELEQALTSAAVLAGGQPIRLEHLPAAVREARQPPAPPADDPLRAELAERLESNRGNISAVARAMGKTRKQIQRWLKRLRLDAESFRR